MLWSKRVWRRTADGRKERRKIRLKYRLKKMTYLRTQLSFFFPHDKMRKAKRAIEEDRKITRISSLVISIKINVRKRKKEEEMLAAFSQEQEPRWQKTERWKTFIERHQETLVILFCFELEQNTCFNICFPRTHVQFFSFFFKAIFHATVFDATTESCDGKIQKLYIVVRKKRLVNERIKRKKNTFELVFSWKNISKSSSKLSIP